MQKQKFAVIVLIFAITFSPFSFSNIFAQSQETDFEEIIGYEEWTTSRTISGFVNVNPGATLVIKKGVTLTFGGGNINVQGKMIVSGTVKNPVVFQKAGDSSFSYSINVDSDASLVMRNAEMSGAGYEISMVHNKQFFNTARAFAVGGITVSGGRIDIQGSSFHDNYAAITVMNGEARVNRSQFFNNQSDVSQGEGDFRFNWWGSSTGPEKTCYTYNNGQQSCYYEKIDSSINVFPWLEKPDFKDPVVLLPGILGSQKKDGQWRMDLILHTYDNLYEALLNNGYVPEVNLFTFPYEWRDSNAENAKLLRQKIEEIKSAADWPKVDIVAHSIGGLLAREYIESDEYQNDIDQLITLGTPHNGAPEAYIKWDGAEWFWNPGDFYVKHIIKQEVAEDGQDIFDYIHSRVISLRELLPVYNYLRDVQDNLAWKIYPQGYPRNEFLENLNSVERKTKLQLVEFDKIIGEVGSETSTVAGFKVVEANMGKYWIHGYPHGFEIPIGDRGIFRTDGDRTVPAESAKSENIPADETITLNSMHRIIPTDAQKDILELLTGHRPLTEVRDSLIKDILFVSVYSPIDIQIISPSGLWTGKNITELPEDRQISGAYYSGFETKNEFATIPNPEDGEYKILTQGTGDGEYRVETTSIQENTETGEVAENTKIFAGIANAGAREEKTLEINNGAVESDVQPEKDIAPPEAKISFDTETNSVKIEGLDENPVSIAYVEIPPSGKKQKNSDKTTIATLTDQVGNATALSYTEKKPDKEGRIAVVLNSITRNGETSVFPETVLKYRWAKDKDNLNYRIFAAHLKTSDSVLEAHYRPKKNLTVIMQKPREMEEDENEEEIDQRPIKERLPGLVVPRLETTPSKIKIIY